MSNLWTKTSTILLGTAVFISTAAIVLRRYEAGLFVGYRVDGRPCVVNVVSSVPQTLTHTIIRRRPFCPADLMLSPDGRYVVIIDFTTAAVYIKPTGPDF
jgi:hypothetical protein